MPHLLDSEDLIRALAKVPDWCLADGQISRTYAFPSYMEGMEFVNQVAKVAEEMNHHPEIKIGWGKVTLVVCTHSKGGLTDLDFAFALRVDAI